MVIKIRPWTKEDVPVLAALANNFNIWKNVRDRLPYPYSEKDAEEWIDFTLFEQPAANFAIEADGVAAGAIGFILHDDIHRKNIEIGYFIDEAYWNLGIATRAVSILLGYIKKEFNVVRITAEVYAHNKTSMKVLRSNGFYLESIRRKSTIKNNIVIDDYVWVKMLDN